MFEFDVVVLVVKYVGLSGMVLMLEQVVVWWQIEWFVVLFYVVDKFLFGVLLWNFSILYKFKYLIDVILQKDVLFMFDVVGFVGKLVGKKVVVVYVCGLVYQLLGLLMLVVEFDLQCFYMEMWFRFVGVMDVIGIVVECMLFLDGKVDCSCVIDEVWVIVCMF